jgi:alkylated DNA repair dioxygenase AlkB
MTVRCAASDLSVQWLGTAGKVLFSCQNLNIRTALGRGDGRGLRQHYAASRPRQEASTMGQLSLLGAPPPRTDRLELPDADVRLQHGVFSAREADDYFARLMVETPWRQDKIAFYGKVFDLPRLQQWYGDEGLSYVWSGIVMNPLPWSPTLLEVKARAEAIAGETFNTVLLNRYRDGNDTVAWHTDDEKELGDEPVIGSVSFGAERDFVLRHSSRKELDDVTLKLTHGSVLVMAGPTQRCWKHSVPRRKRVTDERINLTFRRINPVHDRR